MNISLNDEAFIQRAYWSLLLRAPDPAGMSYYLDKLRSGMSRAQMVRELLTSEEFRILEASFPGVLSTDMSNDDTTTDTQAGPAGSLSELLALHDRRFIESAYQTIIHREPDNDGIATYLRLLRSGLSKYRILDILRNSPEGLRCDINLPGLDLALRRYRRTLMPVFGPLFSFLYRIEYEGPATARARRIENLLYRICREIGMHSIDDRDLSPTISREKSQLQIQVKQVSTEKSPFDSLARPTGVVTAALRSLPSMNNRMNESTMTSKHAAITIVSKNYLAFAQTLAASYKKHHPLNDFIIVLVDRADQFVPPILPCGAEVIEMADLSIPDVSRMIYRYTIMELNTAVKPYVLADLFERRCYETLLYIDPDIKIFQPLRHVYDAFSRASIVLTPHLRRPYYDDGLPSEKTILQSGTYNLGFLGLKKSASAQRLLDWWMTKLYGDCVVDIPNGLFVDQKWIDLVPGFFPDHEIIYHPGYNAAYWNLHERPLSGDRNGWFVDGEPLVFFHFSGYLPYSPQTFSRHQNRFQLKSVPLLKVLTETYSDELIANGYEESNSWPYAFENLANGVTLPMDLVRQVMQWALRTGVPTPDPVEDPDRFCRFLMSRNVVPDRPNVVLLFHFLLQLRGDVSAAYPNATYDSDDAGFRAWIAQSGIKEYKLLDLLKYESPHAICDYVSDTFNKLRKNGRDDGLANYKNMWSGPNTFSNFIQWIESHGVKQLGLSPAHAQAFRTSIPAIGRILNIYFLRGDLQESFPSLWDADQVTTFASWLRVNRYNLELTLDDISLFTEFACAKNELIEKMRFLYQHKGKIPESSPNFYAVDDRRLFVGSRLTSAQIRDFLYAECSIEPEDHFLARFGNNPCLLEDFDKCSIPGLDPRKNFDYVKRLRDGMRLRNKPITRVNLAGYMNAPSGMGESGRSMRATLATVNAITREFYLPHPLAQYDEIPQAAEIFGWPSSCADISITIANADTANVVETVLPRSFWAKKNIGYWVWETEQLPFAFKEAAQLFDEIWSPSQYSGDAIAQTVECPVRVLPHTLDFCNIDAAVPARQLFGLPEKALLFGFMFDPLSVLERKNVAGLVKAFKSAFRKDDNCYLVLKANGKVQGSFDYEMIKANAKCDRILFLESTLSREEIYKFMKSLDVYVSLHRSEGFGLTCAEAMAMGLPVIASNYSGNLEFMTPENSLLIPTAVLETDRPYGPYPAGSRWGDPDLEAASAAMRQLLDKEKRASLGQTGRTSVKKTLSLARIGEIARTLIKITRDQSASVV